MKNAIKFFWTKEDNLISIQSKLINLIGCDLIQRQNEDVPVTIFSVSEIKEDCLEGVGIGYIPATTEHNPRGEFAVWRLKVDYGRLCDDGSKLSSVYHFDIPRTNQGFLNDIKNTPYMIEDNHPFVFYDYLINSNNDDEW